MRPCFTPLRTTTLLVVLTVAAGLILGVVLVPRIARAQGPQPSPLSVAIGQDVSPDTVAAALGVKSTDVTVHRSAGKTWVEVKGRTLQPADIAAIEARSPELSNVIAQILESRGLPLTPSERTELAAAVKRAAAGK